MPKLLAFSSSRVGNSGFLEKAIPEIKKFLGEKELTVAFIPFASVEKDYHQYGKMVEAALKDLPYHIVTVDHHAKSVVETADAIMVGGGNTFKLLHDLYAHDMIDLICHRVKNGIPYIGWSAGANIAGLTIATTNDMPIIQPESFKALGFFLFQINPHYINQKQEGHNGETRDQRLAEFLKLNPSTSVVALPEGTALKLENNKLHFIGDREGVLFQQQENQPSRNKIEVNKDLSFLL